MYIDPWLTHWEHFQSHLNQFINLTACDICLTKEPLDLHNFAIMKLLIKGLGLISVLLSKADGQIDSPPQCSQCKFYDDRCCQNRHDLQPDWMDRAANICPILISGMIIELLLSHLSKGLKQKCRQLLKPFSVTVFHGLLWGMIHLNQSLSSRNYINFLSGFWEIKWFLELTLTKKETC